MSHSWNFLLTSNLKFVRCGLARSKRPFCSTLHLWKIVEGSWVISLWSFELTSNRSTLPNQPHHLLRPKRFNIPKKQSLKSTKMAVRCSEKTHLKSAWPFFPEWSRSLTFGQDLCLDIIAHSKSFIFWKVTIYLNSYG